MATCLAWYELCILVWLCVGRGLRDPALLHGCLGDQRPTSDAVKARWVGGRRYCWRRNNARINCRNSNIVVISTVVAALAPAAFGWCALAAIVDAASTRCVAAVQWAGLLYVTKLFLEDTLSKWTWFSSRANDQDAAAASAGTCTVISFEPEASESNSSQLLHLLWMQEFRFCMSQKCWSLLFSVLTCCVVAKKLGFHFRSVFLRRLVTCCVVWKSSPARIAAICLWDGFVHPWFPPRQKRVKTHHDSNLDGSVASSAASASHPPNTGQSPAGVRALQTGTGSNQFAEVADKTLAEASVSTAPSQEVEVLNAQTLQGKGKMELVAIAQGLGLGSLYKLRGQTPEHLREQIESKALQQGSNQPVIAGEPSMSIVASQETPNTGQSPAGVRALQTGTGSSQFAEVADKTLAEASVSTAPSQEVEVLNAQTLQGKGKMELVAIAQGLGLGSLYKLRGQTPEHLREQIESKALQQGSNQPVIAGEPSMSIVASQETPNTGQSPAGVRALQTGTGSSQFAEVADKTLAEASVSTAPSQEVEVLNAQTLQGKGKIELVAIAQGLGLGSLYKLRGQTPENLREQILSSSVQEASSQPVVAAEPSMSIVASQETEVCNAQTLQNKGKMELVRIGQDLGLGSKHKLRGQTPEELREQIRSKSLQPGSSQSVVADSSQYATFAGVMPAETSMSTVASQEVEVLNAQTLQGKGKMELVVIAQGLGLGSLHKLRGQTPEHLREQIESKALQQGSNQPVIADRSEAGCPAAVEDATSSQFEERTLQSTRKRELVKMAQGLGSASAGTSSQQTPEKLRQQILSRRKLCFPEAPVSGSASTMSSSIEQQDPLVVLKNRVVDKVCLRWNDRTVRTRDLLKRLRKLKVEEAANSMSRQALLAQLREKVCQGFAECLEAGLVCSGSTVASGAAVVEEKLWSHARAMSSRWDAGPVAWEPHADCSTRGQQVCKQLATFRREHGRYPIRKPSKQHQETDAGKQELKLYRLNHALLKRYYRIRCKPTWSKVECVVVRDLQSLPGWAMAGQSYETYIPAALVGPERELRTPNPRMICSAPDVCLLCSASCAHPKALEAHCKACHGSYAEYRKRVLFLAQKSAPLPLTGEEKRAMVQNCSQFQVACVPGSVQNDWQDTSAKFEPRREIACAVCARLNFPEKRFRVRLFCAAGQPGVLADSSESESSSCDTDSDKTGRTDTPVPCHVQDPHAVDKLLDVRRYAARWPLIPAAELFASSVVHPVYPHMKWLLHTRSVCMQPDTFGACGDDDTEPGCAGVASSERPVFLCDLCRAKLCKKKPSMPGPALSNDNWVGRQHRMFGSLTQAERWLLSLGRPCWKKILLGHKGTPESEAQVALTGNTVFLSQPTAGVPTMQLPPAPDFLSEALVVAFTGSTTSDLSNASWAIVDRQKYLAAADYRKQVCPAFANVAISEVAAQQQLPERGVPEIVQRCGVAMPEVSSVKQYFPGLAGEDVRPPDLHPEDAEESGASDASGLEHPCPERSSGEQRKEPIIGMDCAHDEEPVRMLAAFQENLHMLQEEAQKVARLEARKMMQDGEGESAPCTDTSGRESCKQIAVDVKTAAQKLGPQARLRLEEAIRKAESQRHVSPQALAVPTNEPLSFFHAGTWPACFTQFLYGDAVPGLQRDAAVMFEDLFAFLLDRQELEYTVPGEAERFHAPARNRFNTPEMIAVFADVRRRLALLSSTRATLSRQGFVSDLKLIADARPQDFLDAMGILGKDAPLRQVAAHPAMPDRLKAVLRCLAISVLGVVGRRRFYKSSRLIVDHSRAYTSEVFLGVN